MESIAFLIDAEKLGSGDPGLLPALSLTLGVALDRTSNLLDVIINFILAHYLAGSFIRPASIFITLCVKRCSSYFIIFPTTLRDMSTMGITVLQIKKVRNRETK